MTTEEWKQLATTALLNYAKTFPTFTAERAWTTLCETLGEPESVSMKGYLFREVLVKPGHLLEIGHEKAGNTRAKGRKLTLWKSKLCAEPHEMETPQQRLLGLVKKVHARELTLIDALNKAYAMGAQAYIG